MRRPSVMSASITRVVTSAVRISTRRGRGGQVPMPMILPTSRWIGRITASSTSTTRDAFSRVTAVTTHCSIRLQHQEQQDVGDRRDPGAARVDLVARTQRLDGRRLRRPHVGRLLRIEAGVAQPVLQGEVGPQDVDEVPAPSRRTRSTGSSLVVRAVPSASTATSASSSTTAASAAASSGAVVTSSSMPMAVPSCSIGSTRSAASGRRR